MRIVWIVLFIPLLLVAATWGLFPWYVPPIAQHFAAEYDVEVSQLEVARPRLSGWVIRRASVALPDGTRASLVDLRASWNGDGLQLRRLSRIDIGSLRILPAARPEESPEAALVPTVIPAYVLEQLPVDAWSIADLQVDVPPVSPDKEIKIHTVANGNRSRISLFSKLQIGADGYLSRLQAEPGIRHDWRLHTHPGGLPVLQVVERRPVANGTETAGEAQVDSGRLAALLPVLGLPDALADGEIDGQLRLHWQGVLPARVDASHPFRGVTLTGQLQAELDLVQADAASAQLDGAVTFRFAEERLHWELAPEARLRVRHPALHQLAVEQLGVDAGEVWAEVTNAAPLQGQWSPVERGGSAQGALHLELRGGQKLLGHQRILLQESTITADRFEGALRSIGSLQPQDAERFPLRELGWELQGRLVATPEQLQVQPGLAGTLRLQPAALAGQELPRKSTLRLASDTPLEIRLADGTVYWKRLRVSVPETLPELLRPYLPETGLQLEGDSPRLTLRDLHYDARQGFRSGVQLRVKNLLGQSECCRFGRIDALLDARVDGNGARGSFRLDDTESRPVLHTDWQFDFAAARLEGSLDILPGLAFPAGQQRLAALLSPWPASVELLKGSHGFTGTYWFERAEGLNADLRWHGKDWLIQREEVQAKGLSFDAQPEIRATGIGLGQYVHFHLQELDAGFPIRKIQGDLWVRIPLRKKDAPVLVRHFSAELLGGRVSAAEIPLPIGRDDVGFTLDVEGIDLAALLQLEQRDDLFGSGKLDGVIPVRWSEAGIAVDRGKLAARAPGGFLQFKPDAGTKAMAQSQPGLGVALRALENFRYDLLEAGVNYQESGRLVVSLKIHGENPELHGGHPVHLNINVEENVLTLLKSLQYSDELTDRIGKKYER